MCLHLLGRTYVCVRIICIHVLSVCSLKKGLLRVQPCGTPCLLEMLPAEQGQPSLEDTAQSMQPHHPDRRNEGETQTQDVDGTLFVSILGTGGMALRPGQLHPFTDLIHVHAAVRPQQNSPLAHVCGRQQGCELAPEAWFWS